jgi:peptide/nickel transport system ATP-binding protein
VPAVTASPGAAQRRSVQLAAEPPAATEPPSGCRFRTRCALARDLCAQLEPPLHPHGPHGQRVACHFPLAQTGQDRHAGLAVPGSA